MTGTGNVSPMLKKKPDQRRLWNWLLLVPLALLIYPALYARATPELFGFPFFYWYQFAVVVATALLTGLVYWMTRRGED